MDPSQNEPEIPMSDVFRDVPLFREIQRVLLSSTGPVNWELARQVGIATAAWGGDQPLPTAEDQRGLAETVRAAELAVAAFTGMPPPFDVTEVNAVGRGQWVEANVRGLRDLLNPIGQKLASTMSAAGGDVPSPALGGGDFMEVVMQRVAPLLLGVQVGAVLGYLGQRVLGQFDLAVPRPGGALYFVIPNIAGFERDWSLPAVDFRAWIAVHEVTHRFEFARPWVRDHFLALVRDLVEHAELDMAGLEQRLEGLDLSNPEALTEAFEGVGNMFGQASSSEQRLRIARVQAFMAAAEGYGEHVTERVGREMLSSFRQIEEAVRRHREGGPGDRALERLLGLEMKLEQYQLGREFCARVAELTDEATLARMWESPEALPSMPEFEEPTLWLARMA
ncbi:MAG TPA: zinc-dependent metalloprotease [Actinomycetota bacterium]|nr:zinc-dependent metalloprotease [Actinomycetota bacterium]